MTLRDEFNALQSDEAKWKWLIGRKDDRAVVMLDNDDTFVRFLGHKDDGSPTPRFEDWIGNGPGVSILLSVLGIQNEGV